MVSESVALSGHISIDRLEAVRQDLAARLAAGPVVVDTSNLEDASLALLQLLYAAHRTAMSRGVGFSVSCPKGGVLERALGGFGFLDAAGGAPRVEDGAWIRLNP